MIEPGHFRDCETCGRQMVLVSGRQTEKFWYHHVEDRGCVRDFIGNRIKFDTRQQAYEAKIVFVNQLPSATVMTDPKKPKLPPLQPPDEDPPEPPATKEAPF